MRRTGFTLIELVVAMTILVVLIYMAFGAFSFVGAISRSQQSRESVLEDMSTVLDQVTKELRQTYTLNDNTLFHGIEVPTTGSTRDIGSISTLVPPYHSFDDRRILRFYIVDDAGTKHRITYTLGVPTDGSGNYIGISRQYWADASQEACEVRYSNETYDGTQWTGVGNLPITGQVMTNFTVIRPSWSEKVIQVVIEATVKDTSGRPIRVSRIAQVTLRQ